jgi:hypothetical protein
MGNIIGEPFKDYVDNQIKKRQEIHGKTNRTAKEISYLNSTNAWVKLASGVILTQERVNLLKKTYRNSLASDINPGKELAMQNVLFNGLSSVGGTTLSKNPNPNSNSREFLNFMNKDNREKEFFQSKQRTNFLGPNGAYGVGGNDFGIVPMPSIINVNSEDLNRGSIKRSRVKIKAYNKQQFDIIDVLYLRLGYTVLLEFGNNQYWNDKTNDLTQMGSTLIDRYFFEKDENYYDLLKKIESLRKEKRGNYDALLGKIVNFSWTFAPDGTYDIDLDIISIGDVVESLRVNLPPSGKFVQAYSDPQILKNRFKKNEVKDPTDLNVLYPELVDKLKEWYKTTSEGTDLNVKFALPRGFVPFKSESSDERRSEGVVPLTNRDYRPTEVELSKGRGNISVFNLPTAEDITTNVLGKNNLNYYLKEAVKFAIIMKVNGYYGGEGFPNPLQDSTIQKENNQYVENEDGTLKIKPEVKGTSLETAYTKLQTITQEGRSYSIEGIDPKTTPGLIGVNSVPSNIKEILGNGKFLRSQKNITKATFNFNAEQVKGIRDANFALDSDSRSFQLRESIKETSPGVYNYIYYTSATALPYPDTAYARFLALKTLTFPQQISYKPPTDPQLLNAQISLFKNIPEEEFLQLVIEFFQEVGAAGGAQDNQFAEQPEYASFSQELEYEKNKDRVYQWFYNIRKYYTGITQASADLYKDTEAQEQGKKYGTIFVEHIRNKINETKKIGFVLNPYKNTLEDSSDWSKKVGFPHYKEDYQNIDIVTLDKIGTNIFNLEDRYKYFVRLKTFLEFIQSNIIPQISTPTSQDKVPLIKIDTDSSSNICYAIDNMVSSDIRSCIIQNLSFTSTSNNITKLFSGQPGLDNFFCAEPINGYIYGRPMNVYMNFEFIQTSLDSLQGEDGITNLFDLLKKICSEINKCLGYVNNLEPIIDQEENTIRIIDQTPIPGIKDILTELKNDQDLRAYPNYSPNNPAMLEVFGYNTKNNQSNFIHNIGLTTNISKRYASMITIGATANGSVPGLEATAFSKWNSGVIDRIKPEIVDATSEKKETLEEQYDGVIQNYKELIDNGNPETIYKLLNLTKTGEIEPIYLTNNGPIIENFYKYAQAKSSQSGSLESSVGFLPFNLQIDMEGLSGMKIYNRVNVNTQFLPSNYPETLDFIITQVNHKLENNKWVTSLQTQATNIIKKDKEGNIIDTSKLLKFLASQDNQDQSNTISDNTLQSKIIDDNTATNIPIFSTYKNEITAQQAADQFHPGVRSKFLQFFTKILEIKGYKYIITSSYRTLERSQDFRDKIGKDKQPPPGRSRHNLSAALDMQVVRLSDGKRYRKNTPSKIWRKELPELMDVYKSLGMKWGGTFKQYNDPIHFTFTYDTIKTFNNFDKYVQKISGKKLNNLSNKKEAREIDVLLNRAGGDTGPLVRNRKQGPNYVGAVKAIFKNVEIVF